MARKRKRKTKPAVQHTFLTLQVERFEASTEASVNHAAYEPQYAWRLGDDDPVYEFSPKLTMTATALEPKERAGDIYKVTVYGEAAPSHRLNTTLKDVQVRDEYGAPQYRTYRGKEIPVYDPPKGLGLIDKVRGEQRWTVWLFAQPRFVSDTLVLLAHGRPIYLTIHERKEGRSRWLQRLSVQTNLPDED